MKRRNLLKSIAGAAGIAGVSGLTSAATCSSTGDWDYDELLDVMVDTCHLEFRTEMNRIDQNTELVDALDMRNRYGN